MQPTSSNWPAEVLAILRKEFLGEIRSKTGLVTGGLFCLTTIVTVATAFFNGDVNRPDLREVSCLQIWTIVLFASILTLPRSFLTEEEQGTGDLLRLVARPHAIFWGKALFNLTLIFALCLIVGILYAALTGLAVRDIPLYGATMLAGGAAMTGVVTSCGAIASRAANRTLLAGAISLPLVLPPCHWGVTGLEAAIRAGQTSDGWMAVVGLSAYAVLSHLIAPWIYATIWKG